jgi:hypothetical protein
MEQRIGGHHWGEEQKAGTAYNRKSLRTMANVMGISETGFRVKGGQGVYYTKYGNTADSAVAGIWALTWHWHDHLSSSFHPTTVLHN